MNRKGKWTLLATAAVGIGAVIWICRKWQERGIETGKDELADESPGEEEPEIDGDVAAEEDESPSPEYEPKIVEGKIIVRGYDWGPGVDKVVFELSDKAFYVSGKSARIETKGEERRIRGAYLSTSHGERIQSRSSRFVTFDLETDFSVNGNPLVFDANKTFGNNWAEDYPLKAFFEIEEEGERCALQYEGNCRNKTNLLSPDTEGWIRLPEISGTYRNPFTKKYEVVTLQRAACEPAALKEDGKKHPLVIWLHGQGEGGTDPDIVLLGNKVSALAKPAIQDYFSTPGGAGGAFVYIVQSPTCWMDEGDGTNGKGDNESRYTEALMDAIKIYVESNPSVDTRRIYLCGCSNGGYMTVNMLIHYPEYFAAGIPCCEAYAFHEITSTGDGNAMGGKNEVISKSARWMTDEKIHRIKDIPIWFLASADDTVVPPAAFELPTYQALLRAGANNCWFSYYDCVKMADDANARAEGHWVWIYFFNGLPMMVQDRTAIRESKDRQAFGFVPGEDTGGTQKAKIGTRTFENCFEWLNEQKRGQNE
ncbi:MAG: prolyl oligopeptidase family serine peptidase [Lachnospiraceae bacterium]|nr:prolyl oligopeptidase family serine peptidase [Lachnospiraceae bacterium]